MNYYERVAKTIGLALLLLTLAGTAIALFVLASDAFFLIYLAILFAVLLAHMAAYLQRWIPLGYSWNLAIVVLLLIAVTIGSGLMFGAAVQQQAQRTSRQLDNATVKLAEWLHHYPTAKRALVSIPVLGNALEELTAVVGRDNSPGTSTEPDSPPPDLKIAGEGQADSAKASQKTPTATARPTTDGASSPHDQAWLIVGRIFSTTFGALTSLAIVIFVGLYLAIDPKLYYRGLLGLFPPASQVRGAHVLRRLDKVLFNWLIGRMLTMSITGLGTGLGLWFLGVPLAGTVGAVTALLTFIPNLGAVLALLFATLAAISQGPTTVLWVIGLYLLLQLVESNLVTPLIQQHQTSIPPALLVAFQLLVGMLTGFIGLVVATPLLAALMVIIDEFWYTEASDVL